MDGYGTRGRDNSAAFPIVSWTATKLPPSQMRLIPDFLSHGAEAYGFRGEVWTCRRVAEVIKLEFGVSYSKSQVSRILKKLGWSPQSVMGGVTPTGKVYTLVRQESLNGLHTVVLLEHLLRIVSSRLLVIWEGSSIHRREEVKDFLASPEPGTSIHVEVLPPYAPDLNPSEGAWRRLKLIEMRNVVCLDLEELHMELHLAIGRLRRKPHVIRYFFAHAGLQL